MKFLGATGLLTFLLIASLRPCSAFEWQTPSNDGYIDQQLIFLINETGADLMSSPGVRLMYKVYLEPVNGPFANESLSSRVINLNNAGVKALNDDNYPIAIKHFEKAIQLDPNYSLAPQNLAIAHNDYGVKLRHTPKEALKQFHQAAYLKSSSPTLQNISVIIRMLGKDPENFEDRLQLADEERFAGDYMGAVVEYNAALRLNDDPKVHAKLGDVYRQLNQHERAIAEYDAASRLAK